MLSRVFFAIVFGSLCGFSLVRGQCPSGRFGSQCQLQCRCAGGGPCDVMGNCGQADCQPGFMGPACQQVNSAYRVGGSLAFDGQTSSCETGNSFTVAPLDGIPARITWVRIISNTSAAWRVQLKLGIAQIDCPGAVELTSGAVWDWYCPSTAAVEAVVISPRNPPTATACEIQAYIPTITNVALRKPAAQSGTWGGPDYINGSLIRYNFSANLAVDGNNAVIFSDGSCIVTDVSGCSPFWQVDLQGVFDIFAINVYNRDGIRHGNQFRGFILSLNSSQGWRELYRDPAQNAVPSFSQIPVNSVQTATGVRVSQGICTFLQICEVEVYGTLSCPDGKYGAECNKDCTCQDPAEVCHKVTGGCLLCPLGKTGLDCTLDCPPRTFGQRCTQQCSAQCRDSLCNATNGVCFACAPGWQGERCTDPCPNGTFGDGCLGTCSPNCNGGCNHVTGNCQNGCQAGWMGSKCIERCGQGKFGPNCALDCPSNCDGDNCHHTTGLCSQGCSAGWSGETCMQECQDRMYGKNCATNCSSNCAGTDKACDRMDGRCLGGCLENFGGLQCLQPIAASSSVVAIAAGSAGGAVVVIIIVIVIVLVLLRRRRPKKAAEDRERMTSGKSNGQGAQYQNVNAALVTEAPSKRHSVEEDLETEVEVEGIQGVQLGMPGGDEVAVYYNTHFQECSSTEIKMADLPKRLRQWRHTDHFKLEYANLPSGLTAPYTAALNLQNKKKNRYKNICAYDHSRVTLAEIEGDPDSTYINACFMDNFSKPNTFIASQGPNEVILEDFLRMLWEYDVRKVVMLTNLVEDGKQKCHQYWPNKGEQKFGCINVKLLSSTAYADYTVRALELSKTGESGRKRVKQFHYTTWPDKDVPDSPWPLLDFREKVMDGVYSDNAPVVVHCSAGIGRTGTFVAINNLLQQVISTGNVDVYQCVRKLRQQRVNIVQTVGQYEFLHEAVLAGRCVVGGSIPVLELPVRFAELTSSSQSGKDSELDKIYKMMQECQFELFPGECTAGSSADNKSKNRNQEILPTDAFRPILLTTREDENDYINAVFLPSYFKIESYILTQTPFPHTVVDFWRLVFDYNVTTIVCLDPAMKPSKTVGVYWPQGKDKVELGPFKVTQVSMETYNSFSLRNLSLVRESEPARDVTLLTFLGWPEGAALPPAPKSLHDVINMATSRRGTGPLLVHCRDGAARGGLYCVLTSLLERCDREGEVAVPQTLGVARRLRPQIAPDLAQFRFLYEAACAHVQSSSEYENMQDSAEKAPSPESRDTGYSQLQGAERMPSGGLYTTMETMAPRESAVSPNPAQESSSPSLLSTPLDDDSHVYWNHGAL